MEQKKCDGVQGIDRAQPITTREAICIAQTMGWHQQQPKLFGVTKNILVRAIEIIFAKRIG